MKKFWLPKTTPLRLAPCWFAWVTVAAQQPPQLRPLLQKIQLLRLHQQLQLRHPNLWHLLLRRPLQLPRLHPQLLLLPH